MANFSGLWGLKDQLQAVAVENWQGGPTSQIYTWGTNDFNSLGGARTFPETTKIPQQVKTTQTWSSFSFRTTRGSAIARTGELYGWGAGLGASPTLISSEQNWSNSSSCSTDLSNSATLNNGHTMAVKSDNTLWALGAGGDGRLGNGSQTSLNVITQIGALTNWSQVFASAERTHAIKTNGTLWAWGNNEQGSLGDGTVIFRSSPVQIGALTDWALVSSTSRNAGATAAIRTGNELYTWGDGAGGKLANNSGTVDRSSPVQVGAAVWASVSAGSRFMTAIRTNGTLWAWGGNSSGELGDGTVVYRSSPVQIGALTSWASSSSGSFISLFLRDDGTLWSAGGEATSTGNGFFALGHGTIIGKSSPTQIGTGTYWDAPQAGHVASAAIVKELL